MKLPFLALLLGTALRVSAAEPLFDVHLIEPPAGTRAVAGSTAVLEWDAAARPAHVEEWEAFISVDGGRTYLSRITPHLDATIRRFRFTVPNLPGAEITLLLRFGDEREERRFVFPSRLRISGVPPALPAAENARTEPFDVDEEGATSWVEGSRDGSSLHSVVLGGPAISSRGDELQTPLRDQSAVALTTGSSHHDSTGELVVAEKAFNGSRVQERPGSSPRLTSDILLMSRRWNI